jgi:energy-coupling factor transporter ATP-binding protein EcfA2
MADIIERVLELTIDGFRGFVTEQKLDTDADIVLIVGANGHGKSSLLEALLLVLAGAALPDRRPGDAMFSRRGGEQAGSPTAASFTIVAKCDSDVVRTCTGQRTEAGGIELQLAIRSDGDPNEIIDPWSDDATLRARLTAFFQDDVKLLFDDVARGRTLLDIVAPVPVLSRAIAKVLRARAEQCRLDAVAARPPSEETQRLDDEQSFAGWVGVLRDVLAAGRLVRPTWPPLPNTASAKDWRNTVRELARVERGAFDAEPEMPGKVARWIRESHRAWLKRAEDLARTSVDDAKMRQLADDRDRIEAALRDLTRDYPELDADLRAFDGDRIDDRQLPALTEVLASLMQHRQRWLDAAHQRVPELAELARELASIDPAKLAAQTRALAVWLARRKELGQQQNLLARQLHDVTQRLRDATPETEALAAIRNTTALLAQLKNVEPWYRAHAWLLWDEDQELRDRRTSHLHALAGQLVDLADRLDERTDAELACLAPLRDALNQVAHRFKLGAGALPLRITAVEADGGTDPDGSSAPASRRAKIAFKDGRDLHHFSSGQRSQAAVAFMVAQNQLVRASDDEIARVLPHRILILDDVATSYDLSNLAAETLLWRQLAYTDKPNLKRQIFISSHHEDLSNQLIDLLAPPGTSTGPEYSMRILRFSDWSEITGPTIQAQRVRPTAVTPRTAADAELLRAELEAVLYDGRS